VGADGGFGRLTAEGAAGDGRGVMNIDAYTRIVLTIIAGCLVYFVAKDLTLVSPAVAQTPSALTDVNIVQINGSPIQGPRDSNFETALPVRVLQ
jgi:hypothetical protein